jgi:error-prone DNA polymerase
MYIELHARSAFSFLEGASVPEDLISAAVECGMPSMALLDRDGFYGSPRFHLAAKKKGLRAHIGAEVTAEDGSRYPLLCRTQEGYRNLCRLITRMKLRARKGEGAVTLKEIEEHAGGLLCLTGDHRGPLGVALEESKEAARRKLEELASIFGRGNVYAELQRHHHRDEEERNLAVIDVARSLSIPLVATNGVEYATPERRQLLDVLTCIRHHATIKTAGRLLTRNSERYLKSTAEMEKLFAGLPEAIAHTEEIASKLEFTLADLGYQFPPYPVPDGETMDSFLRKRTMEGARNRYRPFHERARLQIERELALIEKLKLAGYFLIVWDIVQFCRRNDILVQGRGSAANSAVCYSLGITAVDPVGMDLLFERFLSEERGEWPDIDIDLPSGDKREKAIQYVYERYGKRGAAMTANVITYRGRSAAREVGKVMGFEISTLNTLSSLVRGWEWKDPSDTDEKRFREAGLDLQNSRIQQFLQLYQQIQDLPRHLGQHSGGMVICMGHLDEVVPLEPASMPGRVVVQWDKEDCADMGIIKVDLLGLGMMAVIEDTLQLIAEHSGEEVDLAHIPYDDPPVYDMLQRADTVGVFQVESRAQMACLPRLKPRIFYDLVVEVAIIRPGPIVGNMVHPYLRRRQGKEPAECLHPTLEPVLKRTLGVPLFQEQLLRMAMIAAGFSGGEAEELRRAFGFKRSEVRMKEIEQKLRTGMSKKGITGEVQERIIQSITSFALYGFPESHAASFALLAYASAYLKTHYLAEFTAAMLNNQPMGFYHPATLVKDAQHHGLRFKPVEVMRSEWRCTVEQEDGEHVLRLGLMYVRGLRQESGEAIVRARKEKPFASIDDLARRVPVLRRDEITQLASIGALNYIPGLGACNGKAVEDPADVVKRSRRGAIHRRDALWQAERAIRPVGPLFEQFVEMDEPSPLAAMTDRERLSADFEGTNLTIGRHPVAHHREALDRLGALRAVDLRHRRNGERVRVGGCVIVRQRPGTAKGFVFLSLEDETGIANIIVMPDLFQAERMLLVSQPFLVIDGILQNQEGVVSVKATSLEALAEAEAAVPSHDFH